jgi:hypothetical protein
MSLTTTHCLQPTNVYENEIKNIKKKGRSRTLALAGCLRSPPAAVSTFPTACSSSRTAPVWPSRAPGSVYVIGIQASKIDVLIYFFQFEAQKFIHSAVLCQVCISVHNCLYLSAQLSVSQYTTVCISIHSVCISVHNCLYLNTQLSLSQCTTVCISIHNCLYLCTTVCISIHNCLYLRAQLSVSQYTTVFISVHNCLHLNTQLPLSQYTTVCISVYSCLYLSAQLSVSQCTTVCISVHNCLYLSTQLSVSQYTTIRCPGLRVCRKETPCSLLDSYDLQ